MNRTLTGRGVLLYMMGFFGIIFATNAYFITVAVRTFRGEDEAKPYLQGIEYNDTLARRAEQEKLGWSAQIAAARMASGKLLVLVTLNQSHGRPQTPVVLSGKLRHPADENRDQPIKFTNVGNGRFEAELAKVAPGGWDVLVHSDTPGKPFDASRRVWVP